MKAIASALAIMVCLGPFGCSEPQPAPDKPKDSAPPSSDGDEDVGAAAGPLVVALYAGATAAAGWLIWHATQHVAVHVAWGYIKDWYRKRNRNIDADSAYGDGMVFCNEVADAQSFERCASPKDRSKCPRQTQLFTRWEHNWHVRTKHAVHTKTGAELDDPENKNWRPVKRKDGLVGFMCEKCQQCFDGIPKGAKANLSQMDPHTCAMHGGHRYFNRGTRTSAKECAHPMGYDN